eukprot:5422699-Prymnesium_polylepis.1
MTCGCAGSSGRLAPRRRVRRRGAGTGRWRRASRRQGPRRPRRPGDSRRPSHEQSRATGRASPCPLRAADSKAQVPR